MIIEVDFNSDEAIYVQLCNQIIMGIATDQLKVGETLPSVRQLADTIGINMHTVNKAYSVLRQEGFLSIDRRRGAVISIDVDKIRALEEMKENLLPVLAKGCCKNITREEALEMIECLYLKTCEVYEVRDNWYATAFAGYPMWQALMVGGQTPDGKDSTNDLSYLALEAADELQVKQPVMAVRVWENTPEKLIRFGCRMIQEGQALSLIHI